METVVVTMVFTTPVMTLLKTIIMGIVLLMLL